MASYSQSAGPLLATSGLPAPSITTAMEAADRLQVATLKGDDLQAANLQKQLQALEKVETNTAKMIEMLRRLEPTPFYRH